MMQQMLFAIPAKVTTVKPKKKQAQPTKATANLADPIAELIHRRRRQMLVHSCLYYAMDSNLITDFVFNKWASELKQLQADYPSIAEDIPFADDFRDWDGSTGYDLPYRDERVVAVATHLLNYSGRVK